ncbi:hypothetical protein Asppvi_000325 [Aspergillus pseudoviridinutans]|uniref:Uncharacterized protein n=1 Tax=Aspergillus pseudoviridinutans TaxID=1517512 RepID=A0A9P3B0X4_9EURO|nr:uncharacterized protein Asppvi_000325 [Aspergillus pseudoviridinutans]GIJ81822.1 hypothetical protein Asppvi_000325 [Aspergillus pseudoviridinutans]
MQYKTLSLLLLTATALAAPEARPEADPEAAPEASPEDFGKRQYDYASLMNELNSLTDFLTNTEYQQYLTNTDWEQYLTNTDFGGFPTNTAVGNAPTHTNTAVGNAPTKTNTGGVPTDLGGLGSFSMPTAPALTYDGMPPPSIASVLITAVPSSYMSELANPSVRSSLINDIQHGHYPSWYSALPNSVKQWISTNYASMTAAAATATAKSGSGSGSNGSGSQSSASSASSQGAAPAATGSIAASIVGAAGILGLALAL